MAEVICRAGLAHCYLTAELEHGAVAIKALRIYPSKFAAGEDAAEDPSPIGWVTSIWIEEHRGCEHDKDA